MKTFSRLLFAVAVAGFGSGCFEGPHGIPGNHRNNDAPIVVTDTPTTLASLEFDLTFTAYDPDSDAVILWDKCPYDDLEGAAPILTVGYSVDEGISFKPIDPADLQLDGAPLVVPTCKQVKAMDESIQIAVSTSGEQHTFTWNSLPYVPTAAQVVFRVAVTDGSFHSVPGDTENFAVANLPGFSVTPNAARPGATLVGAELDGLLTSWDGTTVVGSAENLVVTNFVAVTTSSATADITMGPDTDQIPRTIDLITAGAGIPSGDEHAEGVVWTCAEIGSPVVEFETTQIGGGGQPICDWSLDWGVEGSLTSADEDYFVFVASSSGDASFSLEWDSADGGDVTDYDAYLYNAATGLVTCADDLLACGCATINKPETGTMAGLVAGETYVLLISHYAGEETTYEVTIGSGP